MGVQDFRFCEGPNHWLLDGQTDTISEWKTRSARARLCLSFDRPSVFRPYRTHHRTDRCSHQGMALRSMASAATAAGRARCRRRRPNVLAPLQPRSISPTEKRCPTDPSRKFSCPSPISQEHNAAISCGPCAPN